MNKGFGGWIEVFRAGEHRDSKGRPFAASVGEVAQLAASYDPAHHEAPAVVGHPADNAPAYGWVEQLKAEGGSLLARFRDVDPGFEQMVRDGRFKKRSVSLYRDLGGRGLALRHVGFLGAAPPAIKGLRPVQFQEGDAVVVEFDEEEDFEVEEKTVKGWIKEAFADLSEKLRPAKPAEAGVLGISDKAIEAAVAAATEKTEAKFNEKFEALEAELKKTREEADKTAAATGVAEARQFIEARTKAGRWAPGWAGTGIVELCERLAAEADTTVEFGEGDAKQSKRPWEVMKSFLEAVPQVVELGEMTGGKTARKGNLINFNAPADGTEIEGVELAETAQAIADEKDIPYGDALEQARRKLAV